MPAAYRIGEGSTFGLEGDKAVNWMLKTALLGVSSHGGHATIGVKSPATCSKSQI